MLQRNKKDAINFSFISSQLSKSLFSSLLFIYGTKDFYLDHCNRSYYFDPRNRGYHLYRDDFFDSSSDWSIIHTYDISSKQRAKARCYLYHAPRSGKISVSSSLVGTFSSYCFLWCHSFSHDESMMAHRKDYGLSQADDH